MYLQVFISTVWDLFFLSKDHYYKGKTTSEIARDIRENLGFLFEQQGKQFPEITEMVRDLLTTRLDSADFTDCEQKREFIKRYVGVYSQE